MRHKLGKIFICLFMCFLFSSSLTVHAQDYTLEIENYINDYADLIDETTEQKLNQAGRELDESSGAQIVFITVNSLDGQDIRQVAYDTFKKYGIGDKDLDNGILFIVSIQDKQRYMEVGTGLEGTITDIASQHLQTEYLVPEFQSGNYQKGLEDLYYQTIDAIQNGIDTGELSTNSNQGESEDSPIYMIFSILIIAFILLMAFAYGFSNPTSQSITIKPGQRYKLNVRGYDFNDESILVSSENSSIVQVEPDGWIIGVSVGMTYVTLQKLSERTKQRIPVKVSRHSGSTRRNDRALEYLLWGSLLSDRHHHTSNHWHNNSGFGGGFGSGGFGGFSGGGGGSRGGGAGGSW